MTKILHLCKQTSLDVALIGCETLALKFFTEELASQGSIICGDDFSSKGEVCHTTQRLKEAKTGLPGAFMLGSIAA